MPFIHQPIVMPEFGAGAWLQSPPLTKSKVRGMVVLVDFWDYCSVSSLHTLPYQRIWWERYRDHGLLIVGVHAPQFAFGHRQTYVEWAVEHYGLTYPILLDNAYQTWRAWSNHYWPAKYLVDQQGNLRYFHLGEGGYQDLESVIQLLLHEQSPALELPPLLQPLRPTDDPHAVCHQATPLRYFGYARGRIGNPEGYQPNEMMIYTMPDELMLDLPYLRGVWNCNGESVTLAGEEGELALRYRARGVSAVLGPPVDRDGEIALMQDGIALPLDAMGADVQREDGRMLVHIDIPRVYSLVANPHYGAHDLRLLVQNTGIAVYLMHFVSECLPAENIEKEAA
jgi:hypothetical protein